MAKANGKAAAGELTTGQKVTAAHILAKITARYAARPEWVVLPEFRFSTGFAQYAERRLDVYVINCRPSKHHRRIAFEIKVSRDDFKRELAQPIKRKIALYISNEFYFVTPPGLIPPELIPPEAGLIETTGGDDWKKVLPAPERDSYPAPWGMVASIGRRALEEKRAAHSLLQSIQDRVERYRTQPAQLARELAALEKDLVYMGVRLTDHAAILPPAPKGSLFEDADTEHTPPA